MSIISVPYWGSLYFNNVRRIKLGDTRVSVPYWGSLYFNSNGADIYIHCLPVSVPYWGSLYFNENNETTTNARNRFRPLLGFFIFQLKEFSLLSADLKRFPSPIGVLYISINFKGYLEELENCFRPLLGFFIFQLSSADSEKYTAICFRPLLGFFIFQ